MALKILGRAKDLRTETDVIYAQMSINDYLALVGDDFAEFAIQRKREKHRAYNRMKQDINSGALLPPITLAIRPELVPDYLTYLNDNLSLVEEKLNAPGQVRILDGLQRTYILSDLQKEGVEFTKGQTVLVEYWFEEDIHKLIYRIIVLNAGQKPMSTRHQVEILFMTIREALESSINNLIIYSEKQGAVRRKPRHYRFDLIVMAYQSFLEKNPEMKRQGVVTDELTTPTMLDASQEELGQHFDTFAHYLSRYADLDTEIDRVYPEENKSVSNSHP